MLKWNAVQKFVEGTGMHSTLIVEFWTILFLVFRFLLFTAIEKSIWSHTQDDFVCNTLSTGCSVICFNNFILTRYWFLHLLVVALFSITFNVYIVQKLALLIKKISKGKDKKITAKVKNPNEEEAKKDKDNEVVPTRLQAGNAFKLYLAYIFMVFVRLLLEVGFLVGQYYLYSFKIVVPEIFRCNKWPCQNTVDCFVSGPMKKTIMLWAFRTTGCIMVLTNLIELYTLKRKLKIARRQKNATKNAVGNEIVPKFTMPAQINAWTPWADGVYKMQASEYSRGRKYSGREVYHACGTRLV